MISSNAMLIIWIILCVLILGVAVTSLVISLMQKRRLDKLDPPQDGSDRTISDVFHDHEKLIIILVSVLGGLIILSLAGYFGYKYYKKKHV